MTHLSEISFLRMKLATLLQVGECVRTTVVVIVQAVCCCFLVAFETESGGVPTYGTAQFAGNVGDTAKGVGAATVFHGSDGVLVVADGIDEVLHVGRANFILSGGNVLLLGFKQFLV